MGDSGLVRRHDKFQFEVKLAYTLHPLHRRDRYRVDTYFFLPENLDVNEATYPKSLFYRDLLLYIRFRTPDFTLSDLANPASSQSPLNGVASWLTIFLASPQANNAQALDYELRLLGCVFKNSLRGQVRKILPLAQEAKDPGQVEELLADYVKEVRRATSRFREIKPPPASPGLPKSILATFAFADEYASLLVEEKTHELLRAIQDRREPPFIRAAGELRKLITEEIAHRRAQCYPSQIDEAGSNETFVFRLGVLKKFISSALHLALRTKEEGRGIQHLLLGMAAGLAMLFATAVAFYYQKIYGTLSLGFFVILVVSYIFKDRMKALAQARLQSWLSRNLFDQSTDIRDPYDHQRIGTCREAMGFVPEARVDPIVLKLRNRDHITEIENTWRAEKVIHYIKDIKFFSKRFLKHHTRKTGVTDILRFNLRNFLLKMDEPETELAYLKDGRSVGVRGARVYHVNMVLRFLSESETRYERIRLVLNRDGIQRIEPVAKSGDSILI